MATEQEIKEQEIADKLYQLLAISPQFSETDITDYKYSDLEVLELIDKVKENCPSGWEYFINVLENCLRHKKEADFWLKEANKWFQYD